MPCSGYRRGVAQLLLVEDDAAIRGALIRALTERGHAVTSLTSAMAALQQVVATPPDLVLLDLGLPDISGYEALRMMRAVCRYRGCCAVSPSLRRSHDTWTSTVLSAPP